MRKKQTESLFSTTTGRAEKEYSEPDNPADESVKDLWDYWLHVHYHGRQANRPYMDLHRYAVLSHAVGTYGVEEAKRAILGCSHSPWHSGVNPKGQKFNDVKIIFRDAAQVKKFLKFAPEVPTSEAW
jgi:hypothetical protein